MADPDWGELIRSELDSYVPQRLPARFVPAARRRRHARMVDWRPVAVTVGVLLLGLGFATVGGGPETIYRTVVQMAPSRNVTPTPTASPTPSPEQTSRIGTAPPSPNPPRTRSQLPPAPAPTALSGSSPGADGSSANSETVTPPPDAPPSPIP